MSNTEFNANGYDFVDMGEAGVWAKNYICYKGLKDASSCAFFEWGETEEREKYGKENKHIKKGFFTDTQLRYSKKDGLTELLPEDDAAHVLWGGDWYTPSKEEFIRLFEICKVEYIDLLGTKVKFTAPNGNSLIFYTEGSQSGIAGEDDCCCWTSSLLTKREGLSVPYEFAYAIMVSPSTKLETADIAKQVVSSDLRTAGLPIRPIIRKK